MEKLFKCITGFTMFILILFSHLDRVAFINELSSSRELYINAVSNINKDITDIKTDVKYIKSKL